MILECAVCRTRYLVPDTAIGPEGRTVRCANCKNSWFQEGASAEALVKSASVTAPSQLAPAPTVPSAPPVTPVKAAADKMETAGQGDDFDAFGYTAPFRPRRNPARRYTMIAVAAGVTMLIGVGVIGTSGGADFASRLGLMANAQSPLRIEQNRIDRHDLPSGSEMFAVSGRIINPTGQRLPVTDLRADLLDAQGRSVYSWTITPEARVVGPKGIVEFRSATLDVPNNGKALRLSFLGGGAG